MTARGLYETTGPIRRHR